MAIAPIPSVCAASYLVDLATYFTGQRKQVTMVRVGLFVKLEAKPGNEAEVAGFLEAGLALANAEEQTPVWFAIRFGPTTFAIFDAFADETGRDAHLNGAIAEALMAKADELLAAPPVIERYDVIGAKLP